MLPTGVYMNSYYRDHNVLKTVTGRISILVVIMGTLLLPLMGNQYITYIFQLVAVSLIGAVGLTILTGFTGLISIGHAAFVGIGAYTTVILAVRLGLPIWIAVPAGGLMAGLIGFLAGIPMLRLRGLYLLAGTLALHFVADFVFKAWKPVTNGSAGFIVPYPALWLGGVGEIGPTGLYYAIIAVSILSVAVGVNISRSNLGRACVAIRQKDIAAELIGINVLRTKLTAFFISSFMAGVNGGLWAYLNGVISPECFPVFLAINYVAMALIGGLGSVFGTVLGTMFIVVLPEILSSLAPITGMQISIVSALSQVIFGLVIVLCIVIEPGGLAKLCKNIYDFFKLWPLSYSLDKIRSAE